MKIIIDGKEVEVGSGSDGFSPTVEVTDIDGGHQVTITDAEGPKSFDVMNGAPGQNGQDGVSPVIVLTPITNGTQVAIIDIDGQHSFNVMNGSAYRQVLTQAQYDALATKDPNMEYCIKEV